MTNTPKDFGPVTRLDADADGPPGKRTFHLLIDSHEGTASLWLEKEELRALGVAIDQLLARISGRPEWKMYGNSPDPYKPSEGFTAGTQIEFKVGQLSLGYETDGSMFVLLAHDSVDDPEGPASFTCLATAAQVRALSRRIDSVILAGRPICPLCGDPIDPDRHFCVRDN